MSDTKNETTPTGVEMAWVPSELDREASALINEIHAEFSPEPDTATDSPDNAEQSADSAPNTKGTPPVEGTAGDAVTAAQESKGKPAELSEFVARELALFRREEAVKAQEDKFRTLEQELTSLRSKQLPDDLVEGLRYQSIKTLEALGIDPNFLVKQVLAEQMGEKAPEDLRSEVRDAARDYESNKRIRALENKLAEQERAAQARAFFLSVQDGAREYLKAPGVNEHAPTVAKVASSNSDLAFTEIMAEIQKDAEFKAARDPSASLITFEEAARRLETRWSAYSKVFQPVPSPNVTTEPTNTQSQTVSTTKSQPKTAQPVTNRPLAPWLQKSDVEEDGLKAAIAEFHRTK